MTGCAALLAAFLATRSCRDRAALIEACLPLVESTARRYLRRLPPQIELSDLVSAGHVGLIRAVDRYDPSKGAAFESWAITCIRGAIRHDLEARRNPPIEVLSLDAVECQVDPGPDPFALILAGEQKRLLASAIARLPERWRSVIEGRFYAGRDYRDLGAELGCSGSRVKQIEGKALERLRKALVRDRPYLLDEAELSAADAPCLFPTRARAGAGGGSLA